MAGGGTAAGTGIPDANMIAKHKKWYDAADGAIDILSPGASPYNAAFAYDPAPDVAAMEERMGVATTLVDALDPVSDFDTFLANAVAEIDGDMLSDTYITDSATEYEANIKPAYFRSVNRFTGGMSDINAVHNSSFIIGLAIMERGFQGQIDLFTANLKGQRERGRLAAIMQSMQIMAGMQQSQVGQTMATSQIQSEQSRISILAFKEEQDQNVQYDASDLMWDFDLWDRGARIMSSLVGTATGREKTPVIPSILGGAFSGASAGAQGLGGLLGPEGAILGLLLGGGIGGFGGLF